MTKQNVLALSVVIFFSLPAFASLGVEPTDQKNPNNVYAHAYSNSRATMRPGIYRASAPTDMQPENWILNGQNMPNMDELTLSIDANESVHATQVSASEILVTIVRSPADLADGAIPEQMVLTPEEFERAGLVFIADGTPETLAHFETGMLDAQTASRSGYRGYHMRAHRVRTSRRGGAVAGRDGNGRFAGYGGNCVRVVQALIHEAVRGNGVNIVSNLIRAGWSRTGARVAGVVCSWAGGPGHRGHVGYFDGSCFQPTYNGNCGDPGSGYRMIGCATRGGGGSRGRRATDI